jgi:hypothetical protein
MSEREATIRTAVVTYFPMFIATLSLFTSVYNGYLNNKFVEIIQRNLGRAEAMRTCKEVIDAYFQVKFRAGLVSENAGRAGGGSAGDVDAANAVNKLAALGTYLANFSDDATRERYTHLSWELEKTVKEAPRTKPGDLAKLFEPADQMFSGLNSDCVRTARQ